MKIKISGKYKIAICVACIIGLCSSGVIIYKNSTEKKFKEVKKSNFVYSSGANLNYKVLLGQNRIYDKNLLNEDETYISEFIKSIIASFNFHYEGEKAAMITGDYEVFSELEGYVGEKKDFISIWKKRFPLTKKKSFKANEKKFDIKRDVRVNYPVYSAYVKKVIEDSKIGAQSRLTVSMMINLKVQTDKGTIYKKITPNMIIPLDMGYFKIKKNVFDMKTEKIEEDIRIPIPIEIKDILFWVVAMIVSILLLVGALAFTEVAEIDICIKQLNKLFKEHGDRLVALKSIPEFKEESISRVNSFEDLVKIADELGKPIMYKYSTITSEIGCFYVFEEGREYIFDLHVFITEKKRIEESLEIKNVTVEKEKAV